MVEDIAAVCADKIDEIAFVIGDFGDQVEKELLQVAEKLGAKGSIYYQNEPLGTAHAVLCASEKLVGPVVVAFADTLFRADFKISPSDEGILWVKQIEDPSSFGVVKLNTAGEIVDFIEKPQEFVSDLAMIGVYYFKDGARLKKELDYLIDNKVMKSGEYQLPDALRRMTLSGCGFKPGKVTEWLDCGNKEVTVHTNKRVLDFDFEKNIPLVHASAKITNSQIIPPCFIGENACIDNSIIGPHVSVGANTKIKSSILKNSNVQENTNIANAVIFNSMIGSHVNYNGKANDLSLGDFSIVNE